MKAINRMLAACVSVIHALNARMPDFHHGLLRWRVQRLAKVAGELRPSGAAVRKAGANVSSLPESVENPECKRGKSVKRKFFFVMLMLGAGMFTFVAGAFTVLFVIGSIFPSWAAGVAAAVGQSFVGAVISSVLLSLFPFVSGAAGGGGGVVVVVTQAENASAIRERR